MQQVNDVQYVMRGAEYTELSKCPASLKYHSLNSLMLFSLEALPQI